ncbi:MAG: YfiR family protein [Planctomycetota bacterium]|nr:YfiR family protein [Planctomycetota bacterium]
MRASRLILLLCALGLGGSRLHALKAPEYDLKAAFLYKFFPFVQWPGNAFAGADAPTLAVGKGQEFADGGGMARFVVRDKKVSFEIDPEAARKSSLKIASQLLSLARIVGRKGE